MEAAQLILTLGCFHIVNSLKLLDLSKEVWIATNEFKNLTIANYVPGDIYVGTGDLFKNFNDQKYRHLGLQSWTWINKFNVTQNDTQFENISLVLHGVDTFSDVYINSNHVGKTDNMFVRYKFDIKNALKVGNNEIKLNFTSPVIAAKKAALAINYTIPNECWPSVYNGECNINKIRKMQASFGWDWGPAYPSIGIWKNVAIEFNENEPVVYSIGTFITTQSDYWRITLRLWFDKFINTPVTIKAIIICDNITVTNHVKVRIFNPQLPEARIMLVVPKSSVQLWWPNGEGQQHLYDINVSYKVSNNNELQKNIQVGFRTIEIVQESVSQQTSLGRSFYFKINDRPIFAKGSNWIPSDILPVNTLNKTRILRLLKSAVDANFNMLRVWGGGIYESDFFYQTCDRLGILLWQDLMFACNMYPVTESFLATVKTEITQQIQRIQHHSSIAVIGGNNENEAALRGNWYGTRSNFEQFKSDYIELYVTTIEPIIQKLAPQITYLTSSPSNGIQTIEEGYIATNPQNPNYGDIHYYNYLGNPWSWENYPKPRFASEYGLQSLPAWKTLLKSIDLDQMVWKSDVLTSKQHLVGGNDIIMLQINFNLPSANDLKDIIYLSQINQAMAMKVETELYRRLKSSINSNGEGKTSGALYWQLNDVWEAPSWSSIDYHGNWKMLHYYARDFFSPVIVSPVITLFDDLLVTVVSDLAKPLTSVKVIVKIYEWGMFDTTIQIERTVDVPPNFAVEVLKLPIESFIQPGQTHRDFFFVFNIKHSEINAPDNFIFPVPPKQANFQNTTLKNIIKTSKNTAEILLETDMIALFVWLECDLDTVDFSKNGFHMFQPNMTITVVSNEIDIDDVIQKHEITVRNLKKIYA